MPNKIVEVQHLSSGYDRKAVIKNLSFDVFENDFLNIAGPNGGGKTTLLKTLLGLLPVMEGKIRFFRQGKEVPALKTGYLPQISLIDRKFPISVREVVLFGLASEKKRCGFFSGKDDEKADETIALMGLKGLEKRPIGELSGGQLQRTLLARAVVSSPELLVFDEPDSYMDKSFRSQLAGIFREINRHSAIIIVSHQENDFSALIRHSLYIDREC
ncbi:MAG: ATP-binding cassette domain-containing protein [Candidatus Azobacteroides sp.]|jgi:zinc transport system ATP-binding protein|nr:ATP-binding cassette domain-containing protein [Candidatus Azobacteroides sp.]